ncbi:hypothetical protein CYLTODRAFT_399616 [Cylindrobasidium torrendii FP15055 ss-10]|uniref:Uncharacterized protein n=1 Tax=Cylindrobasidium torrendii FP15055 ss-10 TaxID=1314674 RepID=A0A0D7B5X4_9AGAR|nr:hypothetical protein CYLTODRAFT_399616 [Cylindrobasidium torrendii FP15055 ss-10]
MTACEATVANAIHSPAKQSFSLPPEDLVHQALAKLYNKGMQLIIWGGMLERYLGIPRVYTDFSFLVPDDQLVAASAMLSGMHLPLASPRRLLLQTCGDFEGMGYLHRVTNSTTDASMQCLHLYPSSFLSYTDDELQKIFIDDVPALIPRASAVYAGMIRMMSKYVRWTSERYKLQSDLELSVNYHLLKIEKIPIDEEEMEMLDLDLRVKEAEENIRAWGRAGEWRQGEEWMEDALIGIVNGEGDIGDLPSKDMGSSYPLCK